MGCRRTRAKKTTPASGEATPRQRKIWNLELAAQAAAFNAAQPGAPCEDVDAAAREIRGWNEYGIGLDVHEWTHLVKENPYAFGTRHVFLERAADLHLR